MSKYISYGLNAILFVLLFVFKSQSDDKDITLRILEEEKKKRKAQIENYKNKIDSLDAKIKNFDNVNSRLQLDEHIIKMSELLQNR